MANATKTAGRAVSLSLCAAAPAGCEKNPRGSLTRVRNKACTYARLFTRFSIQRIADRTEIKGMRVFSISVEKYCPEASYKLRIDGFFVALEFTPACREPILAKTRPADCVHVPLVGGLVYFSRQRGNYVYGIG